MANPPPSAQTLSNLLSTHRALVDTFSSFLTVSIHHILYLRRIYPQLSFLAARAYNYPVRQSRHPAVCNWINDAVAAVRDQLEKNTVDCVSLCIFECDNNTVLERWTFDLRGFPVVDKRERDVPFDRDGDDGDPLLRRKINIADLEAEFRGMLSRITTSAARLKPLPSGPDAPECSFTLNLQVKDDADRPVGRLEKDERKWVAAEPDAFDVSESKPSSEEDADVQRNSRKTQTGKTVPVRRLVAGELRLEVYVEESGAKLQYQSSEQDAQRSSSISQPSVPEFSPEHGYQLEPADVNRKPEGGRNAYR